MPEDEFLSRREVARLFGVNEWTVYRNEVSWGLTPDHSSRFVKYQRSEVDAALKRGMKRRKPGKPSTSRTLRIPVTRSFSPELLRALESVTDDQSNFIEQWMWQYPQIKSWREQQERERL